MKRAVLVLLVNLFASFFFSQINLTEGLIAHWPLDGNSLDVSGNQLHGELVGAEPVENRFANENSALEFNGSNNFIQIPNGTLLKRQFPFSISMWILADEFSTVTKTVFQNDEEDVYTGFWILYNSFGRISAGYGNGFGEAPFARVTKVSDTFIETGVWNHVVANFNALNDIDLYLNGILNPGQYSGTAQFMTFTDQPGAIGRDIANEVDPYHDGKLDDIRYYERSLSEDEVEALFQEDFELDCEDVLPSIWGSGPWIENVLEGNFVANSANDAVLAAGIGDLTVELFAGECGGASLGLFNTVSEGIERVVVGDLIAGQEYSYLISGGTDVQSKVKTYANSKIRDNECSQFFDFYDQIHALRENELYENPAVQVTGFTYKFVDLETTDEVIEVRNQVDGHTPQLSTIPGLMLGHSYEVKISHRVLQIANGVVSELYSDFGTGCTIHINGGDGQVSGCLDPLACNYNPKAELEDGSCVFATGNDECDGMGGVIDNPEVGEQCDDGDPNTINDTILIGFLCYGYPVSGGGCLNEEACNYNPLSSFDDGLV